MFVKRGNPTRCQQLCKADDDNETNCKHNVPTPLMSSVPVRVNSEYAEASPWLSAATSVALLFCRRWRGSLPGAALLAASFGPPCASPWPAAHSNASRRDNRCQPPSTLPWASVTTTVRQQIAEIHLGKPAHEFGRRPRIIHIQVRHHVVRRSHINLATADHRLGRIAVLANRAPEQDEGEFLLLGRGLQRPGKIVHGARRIGQRHGRERENQGGKEQQGFHGGAKNESPFDSRFSRASSPKRGTALHRLRCHQGKSRGLVGTTHGADPGGVLQIPKHSGFRGGILQDKIRAARRRSCPAPQPACSRMKSSAQPRSAGRSLSTDTRSWSHRWWS